jgi:hypothetical protein
MRKAAGILMIISAVIVWIFVRTIYALPAGVAPAEEYEGLVKLLSTFWAIFVGAGGIYILQRKAWVVCLIASILIMPVGIVPFFSWYLFFTDVPEETYVPFAIPLLIEVLMTLLLLATAILPVVVVRLKKREWES